MSLQIPKVVAPIDGHDTSAQYSPTDLVEHGILPVSITGYPTPVEPLVIKTTKELAEFPYNPNMNSGNPLGMGKQRNSYVNSV